MTAPITVRAIVRPAGEDEHVDEAELAAAAFLARYQSRTLEAYRYDLRAFFQWATDEGLVILSATRPQIEFYVRAMEGRGLAATTIDRRLSTVCGFYRFAHIDGGVASNPAQYVRRRKQPPPEGLAPRDGWGRPRSCRAEVNGCHRHVPLGTDQDVAPAWRHGR